MELPSESATLELVGHYGRLRARLATELGRPRLVLPTNEHFPDHFDGSQKSAARLVHRMQQHAHIEDIPVRVSIEGVVSTSESSCASGACSTVHGRDKARLELHPDGWELQLSPAELTHPVALTGTVARALGAIFLEETRPEQAPLPQPIELYGELAAVMLGFGVLLLESSHLYTKACSGPRVTQLTLLTSPELALLTALFAADAKLDLKAALKACSLTQRDLLGQARDLLRANPPLLRWLGQANVSDLAPSFALAVGKPSVFAGLLERFTPRLGMSSESDDMQAWLDHASRQGTDMLPSARRPQALPKPDDELKALVAEALDANLDTAGALER